MSYIPPVPDQVNAANSSTSILVSLAVTNASYSGSSLVLTGAWGGGGSSAYVGFIFWVDGFTAAGVGNNSTGATGFTCTASSAGSITLTVVGGYNGFTGSPIAHQVFVGTAVDCTASPISAITVFAFSDKGSAVNGLQLQWSQDNSVWTDHTQDTTLIAGESALISDKVRGRYYRVVYVNGGSNQGVFRLQTLQSATNTSGTVRDLDSAIEGDDEAELVRAVLTGVTSLGTPPNTATGVYTQVVTDVYGSLQTVVGGQAADAFGRTRVSQPVCLFDAQFQYDAQPLLFQTQVVGGSVTKTSGESSLTLSTGGTTQYNFAANQTKAYMRYEPGKSQLIMMTGILGAQTSNVRTEIGYFDKNDGVFFRMDGAVGACVVERSSVPGVSVGAIPAIALVAGGTSYAAGDTGTISTGGANATYKVLAVTGGVVTAVVLTGAGTGYSTGLGVATATGGGQPGSGTGLTVNIVNETVITQANWNFDPLNGSGISGATLDFTKGQIFCIDLQWLGVGRVRFGFFINGALVAAHQIFNANGVLVPYMNTANLPCRGIIKNTGTASGTTTMKQICMTVIAEGGTEYPQAYQFSAVSSVGSATATPTAVRAPLVSIQPKVTFNSIPNRAKIRPIEVSILCTPGATQPIYWELVYDATLAGTPSFASADPNSMVNFDTAATGTILTITGLSTSSNVTTITGAWTSGANNQYAGQWITVSGMTGGDAANNGLWLCTASAAGSISYGNAAGTSGHAGTPRAEGRGVVIQSGLAVATDSTKDVQLTSKIAITLDLAGLAPDTLSLCATGLGAGSPGAWGSITWEEVR